MATVKKANVPPTHPTVYVGLALASLGLLIALWAYTGTRVYEIVYAAIAGVGAFLSLAGIMVAAWGRSIMASRVSRSRRTLIAQDALAVGRPASEAEAMTAEMGSETMPTVAAPTEKKRFSFPIPKRVKKEEIRPGPAAAARRGSLSGPDGPEDATLFAFRRKAPEPSPVRATLKCPQCSATFTAEGVRPFTATCTQCGFTSTL
jgi:hypothetical protein